MRTVIYTFIIVVIALSNFSCNQIFKKKAITFATQECEPPKYEKSWVAYNVGSDSINQYLKENEGWIVERCPCDTSDELVLLLPSDSLLEILPEGEPTSIGATPKIGKEGDIQQNMKTNVPMPNTRISKIDSFTLKQNQPNEKGNLVIISILDNGIVNDMYNSNGRYGIVKTDCDTYNSPSPYVNHGSMVLISSKASIGNINYRYYNYNVSDTSGSIDLFKTLCALKKAAKNSHIINMSFGTYAEIPLFKKVVTDLMRQYPKLIFTTSAGNSGDNLNDNIHVPSYYHHFGSNLIQVSALKRDKDGFKNWENTNYQLGRRNISSLGVFMVDYGGSTFDLNGTSFASPLLAGYIANQLHLDYNWSTSSLLTTNRYLMGTTQFIIIETSTNGLRY